MSATFEAETQPAMEGGGRSGGGKRGCLIGCAIALIIMVLLCGGGLTVMWFFYRGQIEKYTSETPSELPKVEYTEEQLNELNARIESFQQALEEDQQPESDELVLTAEEINALINANEDLRGRAFVTIEDGRVGGELSVPTDAIPGAKGRYFNAKGTFDVSLAGGGLMVTLEEATVKGEPVPEEFMEGIRRENLAKEANNDPDTAKTLSRFESLEISGDKIILKLKREQPEAGDSAESDATEVSEDDGGSGDGDGNSAEESTGTDAATAPVTEALEATGAQE